jgi:hypothetical protein
VHLIADQVQSSLPSSAALALPPDDPALIVALAIGLRGDRQILDVDS